MFILQIAGDIRQQPAVIHQLKIFPFIYGKGLLLLCLLFFILSHKIPAYLLLAYVF